MPARKRTWTPEIVRKRMRVAAIANRLQKHALGLIEMTPTQVRAAEIMLRKTLPDLTSVEHSGGIEHRNPEQMTDAELASIAAGSGAGTADAETRASEPAELH